MNDGHRPHLRVQEVDTLENRVGCVANGDLMRTTRIVGCTVVEVIPCLSVAVQGAMSMTRPVNVSSAEQPCRRLVLIADRQAVVQPVCDVAVVPLLRSVDVLRCTIAGVRTLSVPCRSISTFLREVVFMTLAMVYVSLRN